MSCGDHHIMPCDQVLPNIVLYIDHEIFDDDQLNLVEVHFGECAPCRGQMEQENTALALMRNLLCNALNEAAHRN